MTPSSQSPEPPSNPGRFKGVHAKVIQERLGHASIRTTLDTYGHLFEGLDGAAADALDAAFSRSHVDRMWTETPAKVVPLNPERRETPV
jgi:hypothetical protein